MTPHGPVNVALVGERYFTTFDLRYSHSTAYSRGDHGMGGGEYEIYYWTGTAIVREKETGREVATCVCGINPERSVRIKHDQIKRIITNPDLIAEKSRDYADFMAQWIIGAWMNWKHQSMPTIELDAPEERILRSLGFIADANDQVPLPLGR